MDSEEDGLRFCAFDVNAGRWINEMNRIHNVYLRDSKRYS
jgi:hypothetical protein